MTIEELLSDETFAGLIDTVDPVERASKLVQLQLEAKKLACKPQFDMLYKAHRAKAEQLKRQDGSQVINFTDPPLAGLRCGEWTACDLGVWRWEDKGQEKVKALACPHPILPIERLVNTDTGIEKLRVSYYKDRGWRSFVSERSVLGDRSKIVRIADKGVEVTTETARHLVSYLSNVVAENMDTIPCTPSIDRLGWLPDKSFVPYHSVAYDGDDDFRALFAAVKEKGDFERWKAYVGLLRDVSPYIRILLAASFASVLIEPLGLLPFVVHLWGGTGAGKSVGLMVAMSVWGNPELGVLVRTLNMTANAIARTASFLYNIPFAGDELQVLKQRWKGNYDELIMHLCEGIDRGRAKAYGGVEDTKTWRCAFLTTGEEPVSKANSGGGVQNRCIQIEIEGDDRVIEDGRATSNFVRGHYGFAGRMFVAALKDYKLSELYQKHYDAISKAGDYESKQVMAGAVLLTADEIAARAVFGKPPMELHDVTRHLTTRAEIDASARAYDWVVDWIAQNEGHFTGNANGAVEVWGKIEGDVVLINKKVLCDALADAGYDFAAVSSKWKQRKQIVIDTQGKSTVSTHVNGVRARYVKLKIDDEKCPF